MSLTTHQIWGVEEGVTMWSTCRTLYLSSPVAVGLIRMVTYVGHGYLPCWGDDPTLHRWLWSLSLGPAEVSVSWSGSVNPPSRDVLKICTHKIKQNIYDSAKRCACKGLCTSEKIKHYWKLFLFEMLCKNLSHTHWHTHKKSRKKKSKEDNLYSESAESLMASDAEESA